MDCLQPLAGAQQYLKLLGASTCNVNTASCASGRHNCLSARVANFVVGGCGPLPQACTSPTHSPALCRPVWPTQCWRTSWLPRHPCCWPVPALSSPAWRRGRAQRMQSPLQLQSPMRALLSLISCSGRWGADLQRWAPWQLQMAATRPKRSATSASHFRPALGMVVGRCECCLSPGPR